MGLIKRFIDFYNIETRGEYPGYNFEPRRASPPDARSGTYERRIKPEIYLKEPFALDENRKRTAKTAVRARDTDAGFCAELNLDGSRQSARYSEPYEVDAVCGAQKRKTKTEYEKVTYESLNNINMYHPKCFEDIIRLIDSIKFKEAVIVELRYLPDDMSQKMLDFMSGAIYALNGGMQRINGSTFLFTPPFVRVTNNGV
ncbi:MAG: cell division protein SepF [Clostridiales bacterium]|jgi:FtsZ-interacting cell division protein YlmF|nr:cell division protein SepF [Clostridiales bacterium]